MIIDIGWNWSDEKRRADIRLLAHLDDWSFGLNVQPKTVHVILE